MVNIRFKQLLIIATLTISLVVAFLGAGESMGTSTSFSALETDLEGEGTGNTAFVYSQFTMCPLRVDLIDPTDTSWTVDYGIACWGCYAHTDTGFAFRNMGCVGANIKLAVESNSWRTSVAPPINPGFEKFLIWAIAIKSWHGYYQNDDFWLDYDTNRTACLIDTVPNYQKITSNRFYNRSADMTPYLEPPMDATGMNLHPNNDFILLLLLQSPISIDSEDSSETIILHVIVEPIGG